MTQEVTVENEAAPIVTIDAVRALEALIRELPKEAQFTEDELTRHHFIPGLYAREYFLPAGGLAVGKQHAEQSFFLLIAGEATFSTADGTVRRICAPYMAVTQVGSKRVVLAHTDSIFLTFHPNPTDTQDLVVLEDRIIMREALPAPPEQEQLT